MAAARKEKAQEMSAHIKTTALELFRKNGFENVSMLDIAEAAGCSVGNIYHYYRSKDELAIQVTDHVDAVYLELEKEYNADTQSSSMKKLLDFVGKSLGITIEENNLYKSFSHAMLYPEQEILKIKPERVWFRMLSDFIRACKDEGSIPTDYPDDEVLSALIVIHRGTLMQWRIEGGNFPIALRGRRMAEAYLRGLQSGTD